MKELLPKTGVYEFLCEPFHCDFSNRLFMGHLGNHLLNAADFHSNEREFGMHYLAPRHKTWVLSRLAIEVNEMPRAYERFTVETWVESAMRYFTTRNFAITTEKSPTSLRHPKSPRLPVLPTEQKILGYGKSIWALIDTDSRQPQDILEVKDGEISLYINKEKTTPIGSLSRVKMSKGAQKCYEVTATYGDTDYNGHVNSIKYIEHILNIFPLEHYKTRFLKRIDIAYVAESYCGDALSFYREEDADGGVMISVRKRNADEQNETEVVRCKVTFVKLSGEDI